MKKLLFAILFLAIIIASANAEQTTKVYEYPTAFQSGQKIIQGGLGFGMAGTYGDIVIPPVSVSFDIAKEIEGLPISFGGIIGLAKSEYDFGWLTYDYKWTYTYFVLGARSAFHFKLTSDKLDPYTGVMLGYSVVTLDEPSGFTGTYSAGESYLMFGAYCGARYFFNPKWAAYAELGYGFGYLNLGVSYKF
ncbi:MAG: hypothetical protein KAS62_08870 [Candidatus Delongbacteria bacterium]|nr:hypothetical protein [Candidatus Delongbacteria bacterium]